MRKLDYEFIFTCGIVAFIAALGMVAGIVVLAGAKIYVYNLPLIVGSFLPSDPYLSIISGRFSFTASNSSSHFVRTASQRSDSRIQH